MLPGLFEKVLARVPEQSAVGPCFLHDRLEQALGLAGKVEGVEVKVLEVACRDLLLADQLAVGPMLPKRSDREGDLLGCEAFGTQGDSEQAVRYVVVLQERTKFVTTTVAVGHEGRAEGPELGVVSTEALDRADDLLLDLLELV